MTGPVPPFSLLAGPDSGDVVSVLQNDERRSDCGRSNQGKRVSHKAEEERHGGSRDHGCERDDIPHKDDCNEDEEGHEAGNR